MASPEKVEPPLEESRKEKNDAIYSGIQLRPSAGHGWWLSYLLVTVYSTYCWRYTRSVTFEYKFTTIIAFGLLLQTEAIHYTSKTGNRVWQWIFHFIPPITVSLLLIFVLYQDIVFSLLSGFITVLTYRELFFFILRKMPKSFTYGEASIVIQGVLLFLINVYFRLLDIALKTTKCLQTETSFSYFIYTNNFCSQSHEQLSEMEQLTIILQIGLLGVGFIAASCHVIKFFRGLAFYILLSAVGLVIVLFPIENHMAIFILVRFITKDSQKLFMMMIYIGLIGLTVATVGWQMNRKEQSNTRTRKFFHILIVLVFIPGLIYQCKLLFVASGIALALLIILETMRVIHLPPIHNILDQSVKCFIDEKDAGMVALTPIYLLVGCSAPLWLHPCPCDLTDSAGFELLTVMAGVLSVGIGDTAASIIGSKFGKIKWWNCQKTMEGTFAGIVAQGLVCALLIYFGLIPFSSFTVAKILFAITINSIVETFTDQVDNIVLPLVTFILLSLYI